MSLVELALKKMQARSPRPTPPSSQVRQGSPRLALHPPEQAPVAAGARVELPELPVYRMDKLVRLDRQALRAEGLMPPEHQERVLADEYRQIKRPLLANAFGRGAAKFPKGSLIMAASAMPGEGKTFTAINLALSIALEKDVCVLLVDADVAKPQISRAFGVGDEPGLLDVLRDESAQIESYIIPTDVPGLSVLPAGRRSDTATELLASRRMEQIAEHLTAVEPPRVVIIDSSPLLLTSESRALAQVVGQVVLVVRAGMTPQRAVLDAMAHLAEDRFIGLVLNQSTAATAGSYYKYGYGELEDAPAD